MNSISHALDSEAGFRITVSTEHGQGDSRLFQVHTKGIGGTPGRAVWLARPIFPKYIFIVDGSGLNFWFVGGFGTDDAGSPWL